MKGPLVFLVSLAVVAALGVALVLPAFREKQRLLDAGAKRPEAAATGRNDTLRAVAALRDELGTRPGGSPESLADRGAALAGALGARWESRLSDGVVLVMDWNSLPRLLAALAEPSAPPLESLSAIPAENAIQCRVTVRFSALPGTPGGR